MDLQDGCEDPGQLATTIMERVRDKLEDLGRNPQDYHHSQRRRSAAFALSRTTKCLVGREAQVETVLASLRQHR